MSRRKGGRSSTPSSLASSRMPAVPAETVAFVQRSLKRNDVELAAVDKLNQQLNDMKQCTAPQILLALGAGQIRLAETQITRVKKQKDGSKPPMPNENDGGGDAYASTALAPQLADTPEAAALTAEQKAACIDFLQRFRLRRKLLNRLFRRLLRVAATMDNTDSTTSSVEDPSKPPQPPRYGEDRLVVDPQAAQATHERVQRQCQAWEKKLTKQDQETSKNQDNDEEDKAAFLEFKDLYTRVRSQAEVYYLADTNIADKNQAPWNGPKILATQRGLSAKEKEAEYHRWKTALWGRIPLQPTFDEISPPVFLYEERLAAAAATEAEQDCVSTSDEKEPKKPKEEAKEDEKTADTNDEKGDTNNLTEEQAEEETNIKPEEKTRNELETKESKQDAPQVERYGTKDDVPMKEVNEEEEKEDLAGEKQDEKIAMQVDKEEDGDAEMKEVEEEEDKDGSNANEESDADEDDGGTKKKSADAKKGDEDDESSNDDDDDDDDKSTESSKNEKAKSDNADDQSAAKGEEKRQEDETTNKIVRPISLIPVPSFYEQDMKRIKLVHSDIMSVSMQDFARRRTQEVVAEYNKALRRSNDLNERRSRIQSQLQSLMTDNRHFLTQVSENYRAEWEGAYKQWNHHRQEFESARLNMYMPHRNNPHHRPNGTALTKVYAAQPDPTRRLVAHCLADVLDTVIGAAEGQVRLERFTDEFRPPPRPDVQSNSNYAQNQKTEERLKEEYRSITADLRSSEEERQKAWKRMMKTKAEFEVNHGRTSIDMSNYSLMPLPSLRHSGGESLHVNAAPSVSLPMDASAVSRLPRVSTGNPLPSRPPNPSMPTTSSNGMPSSDSKYSAARVRERISSDGTVAPVTTPKKTKDGLFVRPAGRTRKGMEWDAVRGIWVPENTTPPPQAQPPSW